MDRAVYLLEEINKGQVGLAGGKGANLGELIREGFPVPPGFVVTTVAYDRFVEENSLSERITAALLDDTRSGAALRTAFESAPVPAEVERHILTAYARLGGGPVAVRSSATAEDLPTAAFAGQQDTYLNVVGARALLDAVRRCWASLWTDRAISYRDHLGLDQPSVKLAVVVQRMVAAEAAGVLFTANPVTGSRGEIVIDATAGLGESLVSGLVTPDHFILREQAWHRGWRIIERRAGRHELVIRALPGGGTEQVAGQPASATGGHAKRSPWTVPDDALRTLAHLGRAIEHHFGAPQDIEWAWDRRKIWIVQARPITALPEPAPRVSPPVQMLSAMFAEMFAVRPYPLDQTTWVPAISEAAVEPIFSLIGVKVPPIGHFFASRDNVVIEFTGKLALRPTPAILLTPLRLLQLSLRYDPTRWSTEPLLARARSRARALEQRDPGELTWEGLLSTAREALGLARPLAGEIRRRYYPRALLAAGLLRVVLALLGRGACFGTLFSGVESTTLQANRGLEALAARVRSDPVLSELFASHQAGELWEALEAQPEGQSFLAELRRFLQRYGHREVVLSSVLEPTWKDAPDVVLGMIKGFALTDSPHEERRATRQAALDQVLAHPLLRLPPLRSLVMRLIETARSFWQIREDTHFYATLILPILRRTLLELGRRLTQVGVLDAPEDVFHLTFDELEKAGETWPPTEVASSRLRSAVVRRKEIRATLEGRPVVDPRLYRQPQPTGDALLSGTAGSPGVAQGPSCVVHDTSEFGKLRSGDVLVAPYTNPAWTPLFQRAAAVVVDGGAAGSHAAIVAREYGIPAVMGTVDGTQRLKDGQDVLVDGSRGLVFPAATENP